MMMVPNKYKTIKAWDIKYWVNCFDPCSSLQAHYGSSPAATVQQERFLPFISAEWRSSPHNWAEIDCPMVNEAMVRTSDTEETLITTESS